MDTQTPIDGDIWHDDLLNRKADAVFLHNFLIGKMADRQTNNIPGSYVLNIDAEWGAGKTFFLNRFGQYLEQQGHLVVNIDAWRDDYVDDPFVAVLAAIDARLQPYYDDGKSQASTFIQNAKKYAAPIIVNTAKGMVKTVLKKTVGTENFTDLLGIEDGSDVGEVVNTATEELLTGVEKLTDQFTDNMIARFSEQEKASVQFREQLAKALDTLQDSEQTTLPLFILIDELDRCRPTYAVALLERVKHLFDIDNVIFVFGTNSGQLQHSITGAYGPSFDGYRYLKRFFDKTYHLENTNIHAFLKKFIDQTDIRKFRAPGDSRSDVNAMQFLLTAIKSYDLSLRDVEQIVDIMDSVSKGWDHRTLIELCVLFPMSVHYFKSRDLNLDAVKESIPDDLEVAHGYDHVGNERNLNVKLIYSQIISALKSPQALEDYLRQNRDETPIFFYVKEYLSREMSQRSRSSRPYLHSLPQLIKKAGQMLDKEELF